MPLKKQRRIVMEFDVVIGLEVHAQLATKTKAWCGCEISVNSFENTKVCEICSAQPGSLPVYNNKAVEFATKLALATNAQINENSVFDRKNYFYPDLPKGYQITQLDLPYAYDGFLEILDDHDQAKKVRIERIQMEEDTGKSSHQGEGSLINLNRAGTPLLEIVSKPDLTSPKEASSYLKKLHSILIYLEICHGNLQDGNFRCDVNVSLKPKGSEKLGTRTEVKNLNSFKHVEKAIDYEVQRHREKLLKGEKIEQQTLLFDVEKMVTKVLRTKSNADDYRYFPEPDLIDLKVSEEYIENIKEGLPELPDAKVKRFMGEFGIEAYDAGVLTSDKYLADYFEETLKHSKAEPKKMANWVMGELLRYLNESSTPISKSPVKPKALAELVNLIVAGEISGKIAKDVFLKMYDEKKSAQEIVEEMGVVQISDSSELEEMAQAIVEANPAQVEQYKAGKDRLFGFFVGQVMKQTKGQANPALTAEILKRLLS